MKNVLIIQTASLGDVILSIANAQSIKKIYPDCTVHFLVKSSTAPVLDHCPVVDHVFVWNKSKKKFRNLFSVIRSIRMYRFDAVINLHRFFSSGIVTALSKAPLKAGFSGNPLSFMFNRKAVHQQSGVHEIRRNLELLRTCIPDAPEALPVIAPQKPQTLEPGFNPDQSFVTVFPGSLWETKKFPAEGWIRFLQALPADAQIVLLGADADRALAAHICSKLAKSTFNFCGKFSVLESAWLMTKAKMNYTNDSAPTHLATAAGACVTTIFCSTVPDFGFTPIGKHAYIIECTETLSCRPCGVHGHTTCPEKHFACGTKIETQQLLETFHHVS